MFEDFEDFEELEEPVKTAATRGRAYTRRERARSINRKSEILRFTVGESSVKHRGMLSKGKVHCSCALCRCKSKGNPDHRLLMTLAKENFELFELSA